MTSTGSTPVSRFFNFSTSFHKIANRPAASKICDLVLIIVLPFLSHRGWLNFFLNSIFKNLSDCTGCNCLLFELPWFAYLAMHFGIFLGTLEPLFYNTGRIKISVRIKTRIGVSRIIRFGWCQIIWTFVNGFLVPTIVFCSLAFTFWTLRRAFYPNVCIVSSAMNRRYYCAPNWRRVLVPFLRV